MHRAREARLDRLIRRGGEDDSAAIKRHGRLRALAAIGDAVRWSLERHDIDPACVPALRIADEAAAELAASGDPPPPVAAAPPAGDRDPPDDAVSRLDDRIERLASRYRGPDPVLPDFAQSSLAELFAWSIADTERADSS